MSSLYCCFCGNEVDEIYAYEVLDENFQETGEHSCWKGFSDELELDYE